MRSDTSLVLEVLGLRGFRVSGEWYRGDSDAKNTRTWRALQSAYPSGPLKRQSEWGLATPVEEIWQNSGGTLVQLW